MEKNNTAIEKNTAIEHIEMLDKRENEGHPSQFQTENRSISNTAQSGQVLSSQIFKKI